MKADIKFRREDYQGTHKLCDDCQTFPSSTKEMHELNSREAKLNMGNDIFLSHDRMQYTRPAWVNYKQGKNTE